MAQDKTTNGAAGWHQIVAYRIQSEILPCGGTRDVYLSFSGVFVVLTNVFGDVIQVSIAGEAL